MIPEDKSPDEGPERLDRLGLYVKHLVGDTELPLFSRRLLELLALPDQERTSAQKLAELVLEDYSLSVNVLRVANSFHYNRSNRPIDSISHAIVVLGMRTVHKLASTLVYFLSFEHRSQSLQQLMIRSMLSAQTAAVTAELRASPEREEVYLAGMFLGLGEVLVACHSPIQHAAIEARITAGGVPDEACCKEIGFTYDELARAISQYWKLSARLSSIWDTTSPPTPIATFARFGNEVTRLMCLRTHRDAGMKLLLMRHGVRLDLREDLVIDIWERALEQTRSTFASLGLPASSIGEPRT